MSDIAKELGAELIKRARDGTLKNGTGAELVRKALADTEQEERQESLKRNAMRLSLAARLPHNHFLRELQKMAAENRLTNWCEDGAGI